jgi:hypothetical protein
MATKTTDQTSALQDQVLDLVRQSQDATVKAVQAWSENIAKLAPSIPALPAVPAVPYAQDLPKADEVIDLGFGFAERLLSTQRDFAHSVLTAAQPVFDQAAKATKTTK